MENTKKTHRLAPVDISLFEEVMRLYKGRGKTLGELATLTRGIGKELNAWCRGLETTIIAEPNKPYYSLADEGLLGAVGK